MQVAEEKERGNPEVARRRTQPEPRDASAGASFAQVAAARAGHDACASIQVCRLLWIPNLITSHTYIDAHTGTETYITQCDVTPKLRRCFLAQHTHSICTIKLVDDNNCGHGANTVGYCSQQFNSSTYTCCAHWWLLLSHDADVTRLLCAHDLMLGVFVCIVCIEFPFL